MYLRHGLQDTSQVGLQRLKDSIRLTPSIDFELKNPKKYYISLLGQFKPNKKYNISVKVFLIFLINILFRLCH
jgi:hypothetical protein